VTCAIIEREGLVLAAQRGVEMSLPLKWEFPGGKIIPGEELEDCLRRELNEELGVSISVHCPLSPSTHHYPSITVTLYPFVCEIEAGEIILNEHAAVSWLPSEKLNELDLADADLPVLADYLRFKRDTLL
jgi:8-oxo-dGTP diphosphatase